MKKLLLWLMLAFTAVAAWGQPAMVSGTVTDASTGRRLEGASVTTSGQTVVTNDDGFFTLKVNAVEGTVSVSHVGYKSQRVAFSSGQPPLKIMLVPASIVLDELLVRPEMPRELVMAAIRSIPDNYPCQSELHSCFYREKAMKRQHYISVAEGIIDMHKTSYARASGSDRVAIRKGRRLLSPKSSDTLSVKVMGGPAVPLQLDLVKNTDFLLNAEELEFYDLRMDAPTMIADRRQYVVSVSPRAVLPYPLYTGRLYIDQESLAFTRAELSLDVSDRQKATQMMLVRKPAGVRFRPKEQSFVVDYRRGADGLMRLSYLRTTFRFNCDWRRRLFATSFEAVCEMVVTSTAAGDVVPIRGRDSFDQRDAFFDKVDFFRDPDFWKDYNIIEPSESLDKAIGRIIRRYHHREE